MMNERCNCPQCNGEPPVRYGWDIPVESAPKPFPRPSVGPFAVYMISPKYDNRDAVCGYTADIVSPVYETLRMAHLALRRELDSFSDHYTGEPDFHVARTSAPFQAVSLPKPVGWVEADNDIPF